MKKILLVGYDYSYEQDVMKKYDDVLFVAARNIEDDNSPQRIIAVVEMFDAILLVGGQSRLTYEIAAIMLGKEILTDKDYPVEKESEGNEDGKSV